MATLQPVLQALGYRSETQQRDFIKLLAAAGAFGELPNVSGTLTDRQALAILNSVTFDSAEEAAHWLHDATQAHMLRRSPAPEDYKCVDSDYYKENRGELLGALHHLGIISEVKPQAKHYDHVLVLGAMEGTTSTRLDMVRELYDQGVRFDKIHLLGNERPLDPEHEPLARVATDVGSVATEMQMMIARAYEKSESWPDELQNVRMFNVETFDKDGKRANTRDTIDSWLKAKPNAGSVLVISSQPSVAYQDAAVKSVLPAGFTVETVGARVAEDDLKISVAMDDIARRIDVGFPKLLEAVKNEPQKQPQLVMLDPANIKADPATYQFRFNADGKSGVTKESVIATDRWDPVMHGNPILVHERLDGSIFVADGHHRLELAKRLNALGRGPEKLAAYVLREADGYTAQDAKIVAAYKNLAHGHAKPLEAAMVFKEAESGQVHKEFLPELDLNKGNLKEAYTLSKLSYQSLGIVGRGEVPLSAAVQVAESLSDPERQDSAIRTISARLRQNYTNFTPAPAESTTPAFLAKLLEKRSNPEAGPRTR